ncbi:MAG: ribosome small subunit-dependent GTPase A [Coprobacillaceae bacterium]
MNTIDMKKLGFTNRFIAESNMFSNLYVGRVLSQYKDKYKVICQKGEVISEVSGKLRYEARIPSDFPTVGDFVMLDRETSNNGNAIIHHILTRKSKFIRKAAGTSNEEQIVASNIDTVFICMSLNQDFNLRRLERYLSITWDSGAIPIIVLTKADLCQEINQRLQEVTTVAIGTDVMGTSSFQENGYQQILKYIKEGQTIAFIGSSGVGKSTLINRLISEELLDTNNIGNDDKGKHTTTRRELILLKNGGMVIDTPGMRELGLESTNINKTFSDIDTFASLCKFHDCSHTSEPGCAVQQAILTGELSKERFSSYQKLKKESRYDGLNAKQIETLKLDEMFSEVGGMKNARRFVKEKNKKKRQF